jgi:uncharacterized membrane protein YjdF
MLLALAVLVGEANARVRFTPAVLWSLAIWGCLHMAGGLIPVGDHVLYNVDLLVPTVHFDRLVHAFGFGAATFACWQAIRAHVPVRPVSGGVAFIVALAGLGLGAVNEVVEFVATHLLDATNVGGYQNTGWDLVYDTFGCAVAGAVVYRRGRLSGSWSARPEASAASMSATIEEEQRKV